MTFNGFARARSIYDSLVRHHHAEVRTRMEQKRSSTLHGSQPLELTNIQSAYAASEPVLTEVDRCHEERWLDAIALLAAQDSDTAAYKGMLIKPHTDDEHPWRVALLFRLNSGGTLTILLPNRDVYGGSDRCATAYVEKPNGASSLADFNALCEAFVGYLLGR